MDNRRTVALMRSTKEHEFRIALLPEHLNRMSNPTQVFLPAGYGEKLHIPDAAYLQAGASLLEEQQLLEQDILVDPKIGDSDYVYHVENKVIFGWVHALQNLPLTESLIAHNNQLYAWEDMNDGVKHVFWRNNEIAGEAAVMHAFLQAGYMPYGKKVALFGNGNTSRGAYKILTKLGADIVVYLPQMIEQFRRDMPNYDVLVNAVLWDMKREDYLIERADLKRLKPGMMIIDISCDRDGAIETTRPTSIDDPVYLEQGILHYAVDHTPAIVYRTTSESISEQVALFLDELIEQRPGKILSDACIIDSGQRIIEYLKI